MNHQERLAFLTGYGQKLDAASKGGNTRNTRLKINEAPNPGLASSPEYAQPIVLVARPGYNPNTPTVPLIEHATYTFACAGKPKYVFEAPVSFRFPDGTPCPDPLVPKLAAAIEMGNETLIKTLTPSPRFTWFCVSFSDPTDVRSFDLPKAANTALYNLWLQFQTMEDVDLTNELNAKMVLLSAYKKPNGFREYAFQAVRSGSFNDLYAHYLVSRGQKAQKPVDIIAMVREWRHKTRLSDLSFVYGPQALERAFDTGQIDQDARNAEQESLAAAHGGRPIPNSCADDPVTATALPAAPRLVVPTPPAPQPVAPTPPAPVPAAEEEDDLPFEELATPTATIHHDLAAMLDIEVEVFVPEENNWDKGTVIAVNHGDRTMHVTNPNYDYEDVKFDDATEWRRVAPLPPTPEASDVAAAAKKRRRRTA